MAIKTVNKDNFKEEVLSSKEPVIIDFNADWCGPCRMLSPIIDEVSNEINNTKFVSINIDDEDELAEEYQVSSIPCLVYIKDGKEIKRNVGLISKENLEKFIGE